MFRCMNPDEYDDGSAGFFGALNDFKIYVHHKTVRASCPDAKWRYLDPVITISNRRDAILINQIACSE